METQNNAQGQAKAQYEVICALVAAVEVDFDRLEKLRDARDSFAEDFDGDEAEAAIKWAEENPDEAEELAGLIDNAGEWSDRDDVERSIYEDPLSVEVRSDWEASGDALTPHEFRILLCTGGPAVQIRGELDHTGLPSRAWIEYQDWGTPWTQYFEACASTLLAYATHHFPE